ncbi:MAG: hypothetical protein EXR75_10470 [Myxococcales bacterium]|nr:hypothetical protein [Myxococcales bacterium]
MRPLARVIATSILDALRARQCVRVAVGSATALALELEVPLATVLPRVVPYLLAGIEADGDPSADRHGHEAISELVDGVAESLARSSHIDDIFAGDVALRRELSRAIRQLLDRYIAGKLDVEVEEDDGCTGRVSLGLDGLGYVAAQTARTAKDAVVRGALVRAGRKAGAVLYHFDAARRRASFRPLSGQAPMLALEEAVQLSLRALVDEGKVSLPCVEQRVELRVGVPRSGALRERLSVTCDSFARRNRCLVRCEPLDARAFRVRLAPLSSDVAARAHVYMSALLGDLALAMAEQRHATHAKAAPKSASRVAGRAPMRRKSS